MKIFIALLSGLGLFLFGMDLMRTGFQRYTGDKIKRAIELLTNNIFISVLVGTLITIIIQSSSATTVMIVGLVNAGILPLPQALALIMGANIGTTITPQILSFNLYGIESIALLIGALLHVLTTKPKYKYLSEILLGLGLLFTGMQILNNSLEPLITLPYFEEIILYFSSNPILGLLTGLLITGLVQSSSASIGMLMAICSNGYLPLASALPILYGGNIGTCITALISSIGANRNARRAALMHLIFNIFGTIVFMIFLSGQLEYLVLKLSPLSVSRQIANAHTLFNIINTLLLLPFTSYIVKLTMKLIPYKSNDDSNIINTVYLDERILQSPSIALSNTIKEVLRMGDKTSMTLNFALEGIMYKDLSKIDKAISYKKSVYRLQLDIQNYLIALSKSPLSEENQLITSSLFNTIKDIEVISDYAENIAKLAKNAIASNVDLSIIDDEDFSKIYKKTLFTFNSSLIALEKKDTVLANKVLKVRKEVITLENCFRKSHMVRLNNGEFDIDAGIFYLN
ncbi:MAG: Na/Pi cotransporter family protein, partial [Peptostreptococcaceae bacterium]